MKYLVVAFIYMLIFLAIIFILFGKNINKYVSLVNLISIKTNNEILENITIDLDNKNLINYPYYGMKYASLEIKDLKDKNGKRKKSDETEMLGTVPSIIQAALLNR